MQRAFPMRGKLCQRQRIYFLNPDKKLKNSLIDEILVLDSAKSYLRKQVTIGRTVTGDFNKSAALATFQKKK